MCAAALVASPRARADRPSRPVASVASVPPATPAPPVTLVAGDGVVVDPSRSWVSLVRTPPRAAADETGDDVVRVVVTGRLPGKIGIATLSREGRVLDRAPDAALRATERGLESLPLRLVTDAVDRDHPLVAGRALFAEVGGALVVHADGRAVIAARVLGPRSSPAGPLGAFRLGLRAVVVTDGGVPALGGSAREAAALAADELRAAAAVWGACGFFAESPPVELAPAPAPATIVLGHASGLPASGGVVEVTVGGVVVRVASQRGERPVDVAARLAAALAARGFETDVARAAPTTASVAAAVDLTVRGPQGARVVVAAARSTDPTLDARRPDPSLAQGLRHFVDTEAAAGTAEERALLRGLGPRPGEILVAIVPVFEGVGRLGESFVRSDRGALADVVLVDRGGVRARQTSQTIAHELGHVLGDVPGHPDDDGPDAPTRLMDSDASDASAFGPRRLTSAECARAVRNAGPGARSPLLTPVDVKVPDLRARRF